MPEPPSSHLNGPPFATGGREVELKFLLSEQALKAAQGWDRLAPAPFRARRLLSVYFDTEAGDLAQSGMVLRMRAQGRRQIMTFKWNGDFPGGPFERGEVEVIAASPEPDPALLGPEINAAIEALTGGRALRAVYTTDVRRRLARVDTGSSRIEVAFDTGVIHAGEKTAAICEVEMELKAGEAGELYDLGMAFAAAFPARIGTQSKAERAARLRSGACAAVVRDVPALHGAPSVDATIGIVIQACIGQFVGNWPAFETGDAIRAVHQMRVALRRLRALLGLFQRAFPEAGFAAFRAQAKAIAAAMGEARNWDVFIDLVQKGVLAAFPHEAGIQTVLDRAALRRAAGYDAIRELLAGPEATRFVLAMQGFVVRHGWRNGLSTAALPGLSAPVGDFAGANLRRLHRRLLRLGKNLQDLAPEPRHEVRKDLKKLRYTADLFGTLCAGAKPAGAYARAASALQDQLGVFNDLIVAQGLVARLETGDDVEANRAIGIILGWCGHGAVADGKALGKAWKRFRKVEPLA